MSYTHLSQIERYQISTMLRLNCSISEIANELKRHASTIRREILRNSSESGYAALQAHVMSSVRSIGSRNAARVPQMLWSRVEAFLGVQHSPEQISAYLPISHESIYQHIYRDRSCKLRSHLRCQKRKRRRYAGNRSHSSAPIANRRGIELRPASVELILKSGATLTSEAVLGDLKAKLANFKNPKTLLCVARTATQHHGQGTKKPAARAVQEFICLKSKFCRYVFEIAL